MAARLPPELAGELYCRANVEPMQYAVMNPQLATELLDRAWLLISQNQLSFGFNYIDKPPEGAGFIIKVLNDEMAHDGYQYMDDEITYPYPKDPRMIIKERSQGFKTGDQFTHIIRRKYMLVQPGRETLALLHYSRADDSRAVVVDGRKAKTPPRSYPLKPIPGLGAPPTTPQQVPQGQPVPPGGFRPGYMPPGQHPQMKSPTGFNPPKVAGYPGAPIAGSPASPQQPGYPRFSGPIGTPQPGQAPGQGPHRLASTNNGAYGNQRHEKKASHKKHSQQPQITPQQQAQIQAQQQAQAQEDAEEPSGDELDLLTAKDVAIARYKRNHDYIAEVFSPYPTSTILPTKVNYAGSIEYLKELQSKNGDNLEELASAHDEKIKKFKAEAAVFYKGLDDLKQATTMKDVISANERVEAFVGMAVQPYLFLRQLELPKEQLAPTPELKPAKLPQAQPVVTDTVMGEAPSEKLTEATAMEGMITGEAAQGSVNAAQESDAGKETNSVANEGATVATEVGTVATEGGAVTSEGGAVATETTSAAPTAPETQNASNVSPAPAEAPAPAPVVASKPVVSSAPAPAVSSAPAPLTHENIAEVNAQSGAPATSTSASVATTSMEVDSTYANPPESVNEMPVSEDTEMANTESDFMNDVLNTGQSAETSQQSSPAPSSQGVAVVPSVASTTESESVSVSQGEASEVGGDQTVTPAAEGSDMVVDTPSVPAVEGNVPTKDESVQETITLTPTPTGAATLPG
ncbi:hypothetical protein BGZ94_003737, partial [Podila epigama]